MTIAATVVDLTHMTRAQRSVLPLSADVAEAIAQEHGVCIRPLAMRRIDTTTGRIEIVPIPCGSTREDQCRPCADKARRLRMAQCRQGWHLDEEPVTEREEPSEERKELMTTRADLFLAYAHEPYSVQESKRLLIHAQRHRLHALWVLLVMLGVRRGEVLALRWADVDLGAGTVAVLGSLQRVGSSLQRVPTKTRGSQRTIPLPAPCVEALRAHRARQNADRLAAGTRWITSDLVFTTRHGTPIEPRTVNRMFRALTDAAGLRPVRLHDLRHGCVSLLLSLGVPPRTVMQIVGHTVMEMTMERYGHVNLDDQREALSLLDQVLR